MIFYKKDHMEDPSISPQTSGLTAQDGGRFGEAGSLFTHKDIMIIILPADRCFMVCLGSEGGRGEQGLNNELLVTFPTNGWYLSSRTQLLTFTGRFYSWQTGGTKCVSPFE